MYGKLVPGKQHNPKEEGEEGLLRAPEEEDTELPATTRPARGVFGLGADCRELFVFWDLSCVWTFQRNHCFNVYFVFRVTLGVCLKRVV